MREKDCSCHKVGDPVGVESGVEEEGEGEEEGGGPIG